MRKKQSLRVLRVRKNSPAGEYDIRPGDELFSVNGQRVRDILDFQFHSTDASLHFLFRRNSIPFEVELIRSGDQDTGIEFDPMRFQCCGNHCIFCFIDQNPKGLRSTLYLKDEDYRLSFLFGNYVTLTRVDQEALDRIVAQRLTPLYVSVHTVDPNIRRKMLGLKKDDQLLEKLRYLIEHRIEVHGQVVLCPGLNDGEFLNETCETLSAFYPQFRSLSVVPVGLTKYRDRLPRIEGYNKESARMVIKQVEGYQKIFKKKTGESFVYLADEFYLLSGEKLPPEKHYGDFWQLENGVGQTRHFLSEFEQFKRALPKKLEVFRRYVIVTGVLAGPVLKRFIMPELRKIKNCEIELCVVSNRFFGESVTVSGLLTGQDILADLKKMDSEAIFLLPGNCINEDKIFLDDLSPDNISEVLGRPVRTIENFEEIFLS